MFYLVNTFADVDRQCYIGRVISAHRTEEAASAADAKLQRSIRRSEYHGSTSYLPTTIVERPERMTRGDWVERT